MKTLITAAIILFSHLSYSQFISNIGVKGGVTFSRQDHRDANGFTYIDYNSNLGFNGDIFMEFLSAKHFNMVFNAGYEQRGASLDFIKTNEFGNEEGIVTMHIRTSYLSVGMLGKLKFPGKQISSYFTAGPRADYYLGFKINSGEDNNNMDTITVFYPYTDFKKYNYGFTIGAGIELSFIKKFRPFIEANYSPRIAESYNHRGFNVKEHYFNIKAGIYIFDFDKKKK